MRPNGSVFVFLNDLVELRACFPDDSSSGARWGAIFPGQIDTLAFGAKHIQLRMLCIANGFCIPVIYMDRVYTGGDKLRRLSLHWNSAVWCRFLLRLNGYSIPELLCRVLAGGCELSCIQVLLVRVPWQPLRFSAIVLLIPLAISAVKQLYITGFISNLL